MKSDALNDTITVEDGCVLGEVQRAGAAADRLFALSLAAEGSCQIGGNLDQRGRRSTWCATATRATSGLGLEAVLPDGRVWDGPARAAARTTPATT